MDHIVSLVITLYNYHCLNHKLSPADLILVLCSNDLRVADYAAKLFLEKYAPTIMFSGGVAHQNDILNTGWDKPEAEIFAERAMELGIPQNNILKETQSTNTGENIIFTEKMLEKNQIQTNKIIVVQKPFMERRSYATAKKYWPDKEIILTSPPLTFEEYCAGHEINSKDDIINIIVGDTERIKVYAEREYQIPQEMPDDVWEAYKKLIQIGYTNHLIKQTNK